MMYFSAARAGFFHPDLHTLPDDAVPISPRRHRALLDAQARGRTIVADERGRPGLAPIREETVAALRARAIAAAKREARRRILAIASFERQANDSYAIALAALKIATGIDDAGDFPGAALDRRERIDAIRAACNLIETTIAGLHRADLAGLDIAADPRWPLL